MSGSIDQQTLSCLGLSKLVTADPAWKALSRFVDPDWYRSNELTAQVISLSDQAFPPEIKLRYGDLPYRKVFVLIVFGVSLIGLVSLAKLGRTGKIQNAVMFLSVALHVNYFMLSAGNVAVSRYANAFYAIVLLLLLSFVFIAGRSLGHVIYSTPAHTLTAILDNGQHNE
jgi:hypothetical protein